MDSLLPLAQKVGEKLKARKETIGISESSAGGLVSAALLGVDAAPPPSSAPAGAVESVRDFLFAPIDAVARDLEVGPAELAPVGVAAGVGFLLGLLVNRR